MGTVTVTTDLIESPQAQAYFTQADRRVMIGLRATLEMLDLPVPEYAKRKAPGPTPAKAALAAFHADNPMPRSTVLAERRPNAFPDKVMAAQVARLSPPTTGLFNQVFPGCPPRIQTPSGQ